MVCMGRAVQREINADRGTNLKENSVALYVANKYVTAGVCMWRCEWLFFLFLQALLLKNITYYSFDVL